MPALATSHLYDFIRIAARDALPRSSDTPIAATRSDEAVAWLMRAQDATDDDGVSYGYSIKGGWRESYVETTGYIATTFFSLAQAHGRPELRERAIRMTDWLCAVQLPDGSFTNTRFSKGTGIVFDTGQDLFGLERAFRETRETRYAQAARRAADWLAYESADNAGRWTKNTHNGIPHVYNTRVAWALLRAHLIWPESGDYERVARANLDWAVSQQREALFDQCAFVTGVAPFTHTIAYAIRGLLESGILLSEQTYIDSALRAAVAVADHLSPKGYLPGQIDPDGVPVGSFCCLTGNCQMSIIWAKLYRLTNDKRLRDAAISSLRYVMNTQDVTTSNVNIRGAIKGSHPIWGRYAPFSYPNWATKFFVDAVLECRDWIS